MGHKVRTYKEYHSVAPRGNWDSPQPPTRRLVCPLPLFLGGGEHSLARKGLGESQFRRGAYTVVLFICTYFVGWGLNLKVETFLGPEMVMSEGKVQLSHSTIYIRINEQFCRLPFFCTDQCHLLCSENSNRIPVRPTFC
jgi:hypothetical protein